MSGVVSSRLFSSLCIADLGLEYLRYDVAFSFISFFIHGYPLRPVLG